MPSGVAEHVARADVRVAFVGARHHHRSRGADGGAPAENPQAGRFSIGFGSRPDGRIAVQRALSEVNQLLDIEAEAPHPWDRHKLLAT
nr:YcaO-like family protein [Burkholderia cepacia]